MTRSVCITGYGLLSPLGDRPDQWWTALGDPAALKRLRDAKSYAPYHVYPVGEYDLAQQVPKPGDQRAMGPMMQYGAYAAGLALEMAGIKGDEALLEQTHMIVAAGGGERDWEIDAQIMEQIGRVNDRESFLNQQLADGLRPTLFLAQLPNLFAGNISIVHGVSGSSRTFMGEEAAGVDAVRIAYERIRSGRGDVFLVGAAFNACRPDLHLMYQASGLLLHGRYKNLWRRTDAGLCLGSAGAFLVLESEDSAAKRGVSPLGRLAAIESARTRRDRGDPAKAASAQLERIAPQLGEGALGVLSGASGVGAVTAAEKAFLEGVAAERPIAVRGTAEALGHAVEAAFMQNLVLALVSLEKGALFPPLSPNEPLEATVDADGVKQILVTGWGHQKGEGMALVETMDG